VRLGVHETTVARKLKAGYSIKEVVEHFSLRQ
jgi:hypothetical protein